MRNRLILAGSMLAFALVACGGGGGAAATPTPATAAKADSNTKDSTAKVAAAKKAAKGPHHAFDTVAASGTRPLTREAYRYQSTSVRDPFKPFVEQFDRGPELGDLRLVAVLYDASNPTGSLATFRDIGNDQRYTLVTGQRVGRISVVSISANSVKLRMDDFGTMRDQTYSMRKPGDQKP